MKKIIKITKLYLSIFFLGLSINFLSYISNVQAETNNNGQTLIGNGSSGRHSYEIWVNEDDTEYELIVGRTNDDDPDDHRRSVGIFRSMGDALDYFDCRYGKKDDVCKNNENRHLQPLDGGDSDHY